MAGFNWSHFSRYVQLVQFLKITISDHCTLWQIISSRKEPSQAKKWMTTGGFSSSGLAPSSFIGDSTFGSASCLSMAWTGGTMSLELEWNSTWRSKETCTTSLKWRGVETGALHLPKQRSKNSKENHVIFTETTAKLLIKLWSCLDFVLATFW